MNNIQIRDLTVVGVVCGLSNSYHLPCPQTNHLSYSSNIDSEAMVAIVNDHIIHGTYEDSMLLY